MRAAVLIARKDLLERFRDRSALFVGLLVPLGLAAVFDLAFGGVAEGGPTPRYAVAIEDDGPLGGAFHQVLTGLDQTEAIALSDIDSPAAARAAVDDGRLDAAFVVPPRFSDAVTSGGAPTIEVIGSVNAPLSAQIARSIAEGFARRVATTQLTVATTQAVSQHPPDVAALVSAVQASPEPVTLTEGQAADAQLDQTTYLAAGMAIFFVFFTVQFGVLSLLEERRDGTLARLLAAPIRPWSVVTGKALTSVLLGLTSLVTLAVSTTVLLGASWGDPLGVAPLIVAAVIASTGVLAVVAAVARTPEEANVWQSVTAVLLGALGGVFFDVTRGSPLLERLSLLTPHQWFLRGLGDVRAEGAGGAWPAVGALVTFAIVGIGLAALLGRRKAAT